MEDSPHGNWTIMIKLGTWMKFCYFNEIDNMNKKRDEFGDRNKIDHMDGIWTILLKSIKCM